jgi:hypothetical protein
MGGRVIPQDIVDPNLTPKWRNFFENNTLVQFDHRLLVCPCLFLCFCVSLSIYVSPLPLPLPSSILFLFSSISFLSSSTIRLFRPIPLSLLLTTFGTSLVNSIFLPKPNDLSLSSL